jgi:hypothetical protein
MDDVNWVLLIGARGYAKIELDHLDVGGRLIPSMNGTQEFTTPPLTLEPGKAVATSAHADVT